jgi:hypothetical protein
MELKMVDMSEDEDKAIKAAYNGDLDALRNHIISDGALSNAFRKEVAKYIAHIHSVIKRSPVETRERRPM